MIVEQVLLQVMIAGQEVSLLIDAGLVVLQGERDGGGEEMMTDAWINNHNKTGYTRRGLLGATLFCGIFYYILIPDVRSYKGLDGIKRLPLKRFFLRISRPAIKGSFTKRWDKDYLIIHLRGRSEPFLRLNRTSGLILEWCDGYNRPVDIIDRLMGTFDVNETQARGDVFNALEIFYNCGVISV